MVESKRCQQCQSLILRDYGCSNYGRGKWGERNWQERKFCSYECRDKARSIPFEDRIAYEPNTGCELWTGGLSVGGRYGNAYAGSKKSQLAHRLSWVRSNGKIPRGMCVLHKCDTPLCVNPRHLFLGTNKDNTEDMVQKGRSRWGTCRKLSWDEVDLIRKYRSQDPMHWNDGRLAEKFCMSKGGIRHILSGRSWTDKMRSIKANP